MPARHGFTTRVVFFLGYFLLIFAAGTFGSAILLRHHELTARSRPAPAVRSHRDNPDDYIYAGIGFAIVGLSLTAIGRRLARAGR